MCYIKNSKTAHCLRCGQLYVDGRDGVCSACRQAERHPDRQESAKPRRRTRLACQCGKRAVTVIEVAVGRESDGMYTVRIPLCRACMKIEQAMWEDGA